VKALCYHCTDKSTVEPGVSYTGGPSLYQRSVLWAGEPGLPTEPGFNFQYHPMSHCR